MGIFSKAKETITEAELARTTVAQVFSTMQENWDDLTDDLRGLLESENLDTDLLSGPGVRFWFGLAAIAVTIQGLENAIGDDAAARVRNQVHSCLDGLETVDFSASNTVRRYEKVWADALADMTAPHLAVAVALAADMGLDPFFDDELVEQRIPNMYLIYAISLPLIRAGSTMNWNELKANYRVVEKV